MSSFIDLTLISEIIYEHGEKFHKLEKKISLNPALIECLEPFPEEPLPEKEVQKSNGSMDGGPTKVHMNSGKKFFVAESKKHIKKCVQKNNCILPDQ